MCRPPLNRTLLYKSNGVKHFRALLCVFVSIIPIAAHQNYTFEFSFAFSFLIVSLSFSPRCNSSRVSSSARFCIAPISYLHPK